MTSWEHGVLAAIEPGLSLPSLGLQTGQLTGARRVLSGGCGGRVRRCAGAFSALRDQKPVASPRCCSDAPLGPFVWIGREKVQSLLRWAGLPNTGRQAGRAAEALPPRLISIFFLSFFFFLTIIIPIV